MSGRLFISHASEDEAVVNRIVAYLEANGRACWLSSRDIPPQSIYADAIADGMEACAACVVILSEASNQSKAVKRELELASHYDKPFIPIRIDAAEPARGFDYYLRNTQWVDYRRDGERGLDRITGRVSAPPPVIFPVSAPAPVIFSVSTTSYESRAEPIDPNYDPIQKSNWQKPMAIVFLAAILVGGGWLLWLTLTNLREAELVGPPSRQSANLDLQVRNLNHTNWQRVRGADCLLPYYRFETHERRGVVWLASNTGDDNDWSIQASGVAEQANVNRIHIHSLEPGASDSTWEFESQAGYDNDGHPQNALRVWDASNPPARLICEYREVPAR